MVIDATVFSDGRSDTFAGTEGIGFAVKRVLKGSFLASGTDSMVHNTPILTELNGPPTGGDSLGRPDYRHRPC